MRFEGHVSGPIDAQTSACYEIPVQARLCEGIPPALPACWTGNEMNVPTSFGDLLAFFAAAIKEKRPFDPKLVKYALDLLEGRFVPLAKGTHACATGFPEVCDVAFDFAGVPTWIARDKDGSAFAFRGFGPDGGPGQLVEFPKDWHVELVHGVSEDAPIVAWPKKDAHVFQINWDGENRLIRTVNQIGATPSFAIWKDGDDKRFAALFETRGGQLTCLDDSSLDQCYQLDVNQRLMDVIERGGRLWIIVRNVWIGEFEIIDDRGKVVGNGPTNCVDISVRDGKPAVVSVHTPNRITHGDKTYSNANPSRRDISGNHVVNQHRDVMLFDADINGLVATITGATFNPHTPRSSYVIAATDNRLFVVDDEGVLEIRYRESGDRLATESGVRTRDPFLQFGNDMCVAFENGNWRVYYGADDTDWDTKIPSTERIQLLANHRAATWKFMDGTLYTRVVSSI